MSLARGSKVKASLWPCLVGLVTILLAAGCSEDDCPTLQDVPEIPEQAYVGSATCGTSGCHQAVYEMFTESGHPYKFTLVENGEAPVYPWDAENGGGVATAGTPVGTSWDDILGVIGGFGWKARFVTADGQVMIGAGVQWNFETEQWVAYNTGTTTPYQYSCFKCHTTGATAEGEWKPGIPGSFVFGGIQCEECHGPGAQHASDPELFAMPIDRSSESCGDCHTRDAARRIAASNGFVQHHEQFDEWLHSPHSGRAACIDCHDPHASVIFDDVALGDGVKVDCTSCHPAAYASGQAENSHIAGPDCVDCHMPQTGKSAVSSNNYNGDIRSHLWSIRTDAVSKSEMFTADGKFVVLDEQSQGSVTLDFACYGCHKDADGVGGPNSIKTLEELSAKASGIHDGTAFMVAR